jgi:hypothetical protein
MNGAAGLAAAKVAFSFGVKGLAQHVPSGAQ